MSKRIFGYQARDGVVHVETTPNTSGSGIQLEFVTQRYINLGVPTPAEGIGNSVWFTVYRGQPLDDLIDALTYYRDIGYKDARE